MTYSIKKSNNKLKGERVRIKAFKDSELMHQFLNKQLDNEWSINNTLPHKAGTYAYAGGQWHNVKSLDLSLLAHI
tara:strand:+ start:642 stop:866 length:225 start_codon:yes stop_codon:yes gene_type:complete